MDWIESLLSWLVEQVGNFGYPGIFVMMFLESTFFPFPSEVAMIPAGFLAAKGKMDLTLSIITGLLGSLLGAYFNYFLARHFGVPVLRRYGKYILFDENKLERCNAIVRRHGEIATFVCRLVPVVRQYISLPAGVSGMNPIRFGLYTGIGAGIWVAVLTAFGYWVGLAMTAVETNPEWSLFRDKWQEHKSTIYMVIGASLAVVVGAYVLLQQRLRRTAVRNPGEHEDVITPG